MSRTGPALLLVVLLPALFASATPAQNLLTWDAWQPWNAQYVTQLAITPTDIAFVPFAPGVPGAAQCGIEQQVSVPAAGRHQLHFTGAGGVTGTFTASWSLGTNTYGFVSRPRQLAWSFDLPAGTHTLRLTTTTSNLPIDAWSLLQPVLRPVVAPAVDIDLVSGSGGLPSASLSSAAHIMLLAPRRLPAPLPIAGFGWGLELDPSSGLTVLLSSESGSISHWFPWQVLHQQTLGPFYLQAVALNPPATFGSRLFVEQWMF